MQLHGIGDDQAWRDREVGRTTFANTFAKALLRRRIGRTVYSVNQNCAVFQGISACDAQLYAAKALRVLFLKRWQPISVRTSGLYPAELSLLMAYGAEVEHRRRPPHTSEEISHLTQLSDAVSYDRLFLEAARYALFTLWWKGISFEKITMETAPEERQVA